MARWREPPARTRARPGARTMAFFTGTGDGPAGASAHTRRDGAGHHSHPSRPTNPPPRLQAAATAPRPPRQRSGPVGWWGTMSAVLGNLSAVAENNIPRMAAVSVSVGGLWRTSVDVTADTTWEQLKQLILNKTAVPEDDQRLTPIGEDESAACGLGDGDEVMCEWGMLLFGQHPLHYAGEDFCPTPHPMPATDCAHQTHECVCL